MSNDSPMDNVLVRARYGTTEDGDRFVGFWLALALWARQYRGRSDALACRRTIEQFWKDPDVRAAVESVGMSAVHAELLDAAVVYFGTCLTDSQYSSTMWRTNRLEPEKLRAKMVRDTVDILAVLEDSGAVRGSARGLPSILTDALLRTLAPHGAQELSGAVAGNASAARALSADLEL